MKGKKIKSFAAILVTAIILSVIPTIRAAPPPPPAFWITPDTLSFDTVGTPVGSKFNVTVWAGTTGLSFTWQVKVTFNATQLSVSRTDYTGVGKSLFLTGHSTIPVVPIIDNVSGSVTHGESLIGLDQKTADSNSLIWIEFQIKAAPTVGSFTCLLDTNNVDTYMLDPDLNTVSMTKGHATYTYAAPGPPAPKHDVAVTSITLSSDHPKQNDSISIGVTVKNNGTESETFGVDVTYDSTLIGEQTATNLAAGASTTLTFDWNTTGVTVGQYVITATAAVVPEETNVDDNFKTANVRVMSATGRSTDFTGETPGVPDGKVDTRDIGFAARAFGTHSGEDRFFEAADVDGNGVVDLFDLAWIAKDFGKGL